MGRDLPRVPVAGLAHRRRDRPSRCRGRPRVPGRRRIRANPTFGSASSAALVNPIGPGPEAETVTLLNATPQAIDLAGWRLIDKSERTQALSGQIDAGATRVVAVVPPLALGNKGGTITLVDASGLKVDGVAYTKDDAAADGWTIVF